MADSDTQPTSAYGRAHRRDNVRGRCPAHGGSNAATNPGNGIGSRNAARWSSSWTYRYGEVPESVTLTSPEGKLIGGYSIVVGASSKPG